MRIAVMLPPLTGSTQQMDVALPNELMAGVEQFKEFYEVSNSNRKLNWYYTLGTCTVKAQFERTYEFVLSTTQAALLMLFNDDDGMRRSYHAMHKCTVFCVLCMASRVDSVRLCV